ncbi:CYP63 cytochrome P450 monooxygenase-like protein [Cyathus striatus]|nr:CYP63 cytochrome P450 monooxygenase-like protein [Cyathus striatus]
MITPGIDFFARGAFFLLLRSSGLIAVERFASLLYTTDLAPVWPLFVASLLSFPFEIMIRIIVTEIRHRKEAAAVDARMVPRVKGRWIGNLDVLNGLRTNFWYGYPADDMFPRVTELGHLVNYRTTWIDTHFTDSPEYIKAILATDVGNFVKGEIFRSVMYPVLGTGVFNSDGEMWKFHRSISRPFFSRDRISHFNIFDKHVDAVVGHARRRMNEGYALDFQDLMSRFTLDSATEFLFGSCVNSLESSLPYPENAPPYLNSQMHNEPANIFAKAFRDAQWVIAVRERCGWAWPLLEITKNKTAQPMSIINAHIEPIINEALRKKEAAVKEGLWEEKTIGSSEVADDETLLDHLVRITSDPKVLRDETLNIMIAGRDTTASTLSYVFYFLSQYPSVASRLREEILEKVGIDRRPTYADIREMKYLRAVINETLRLYPAVPFNVRFVRHSATTWPSLDPTEKPYYIPAGTKIAYSVFVMQRRKDLWGPDAEEFDPDRFLDERLQKYLLKNSFIFLPFNAGPRICLGQQFAYNEMSFIIIRLLQKFAGVSLDLDALPSRFLPPTEWETCDGRKGIEKIFPKMHLTMYIEGGLWLRLHESVGNRESDEE